MASNDQNRRFLYLLKKILFIFSPLKFFFLFSAHYEQPLCLMSCSTDKTIKIWKFKQSIGLWETDGNLFWIFLFFEKKEI